MIPKLYIPAAVLEPMLYTTLRSSTQIDGILAEMNSVKSQNIYVVASTDGRRCSVEFLRWNSQQTGRVSFQKDCESRPLATRRSFVNQRLAASNTWIFGLLSACAGIMRLNDEDLYRATLLLPDLTSTYTSVTLEHSHNQRKLLTAARREYLSRT